MATLHRICPAPDKEIPPDLRLHLTLVAEPEITGMNATPFHLCMGLLQQYDLEWDAHSTVFPCSHSRVTINVMHQYHNYAWWEVDQTICMKHVSNKCAQMPVRLLTGILTVIKLFILPNQLLR